MEERIDRLSDWTATAHPGREEAHVIEVYIYHDTDWPIPDLGLSTRRCDARISAWLVSCW
jgi:hypothetical protein